MLVGSGDTKILWTAITKEGDNLTLRDVKTGAVEKEFTAKEILEKQKAEGIPDKLSAFRMIGSAPPPRPHYPVIIAGEQVSEVSSGTQSPSLGLGIGMAYLPVESSKPGTKIEIDIRGRRFPAEVVKKPFYQHA